MPRLAINLLPESQIQQVQVNPYLAWFLSIGSYLLIFIYLLVLGAFGFRWLQDSQLAAVNMQITSQKKEIEKNLEQLEEFKELQTRYMFVSTLVGNYQPKTQYFALIEQTIPVPITLQKFDLNNNQIQIRGTTTDYLAINQWQEDLAAEEKIQSVQLSSVERAKEEDETGVGGGIEQIQFVLDVVLQ